MFKGGWVVVPDTAIEIILEQLHNQYATVNEMMETATMNVWWKSMEQDIRGKVRACLTCEENQRLCL